MERVLNSSEAVSSRQEKHTLTDKEFRFLCQLVYKSSGIVLDERKREMVYRRLMRRTRELKVASFTEYCQLLKDNHNAEVDNFINAITTNLTSFFREKHHFDYLEQEFLPSVLNKHRRSDDSKRLRIWSAACSTGEEPYSIAISLLSVLGNNSRSWDAKILATDIDSNVVATAQSGVYVDDRISDLDKTLAQKWFVKGTGNNEGFIRTHQNLQDIITFKQLNILHDWPMSGPFDVIFCRNVMIYFDKETQNRLLPRFYDILTPGGILFLGHSESIQKDSINFEFKGKTIFRKPL